MKIIIVFGIVLIIIQIFLYKKEISDIKIEKKNIIDIIKKLKFLELLKEVLIIFFGAFVAICITDFSENSSHKNNVIKFIDIANNEINNEHKFNQYFISQFEDGKMTVSEVFYNSVNYANVLENLMNDSMVMEILSSVSYTRILNDMRIHNDTYRNLKELNPDDKLVITYIKMMDSHCENLLYSIQIEQKYLAGDYTEDQLQSLYQEYLEDKYIKIDESEMN